MILTINLDPVDAVPMLYDGGVGITVMMMDA